jgi:hypothetical protein
MAVLGFLGLFLTSLALFWYGSSRYDEKRTNSDIAWGILTAIANPFVASYNWVRGFLRGGYKLFFKDAAPLRAEAESGGEAAFEIAALVVTGLGMGIGVVGTIVSLIVALWESIAK